MDFGAANQSERCLTLRTTLGVFAFVVVGGAVTAGAIALANIISSRQPPQASDVRALAAYPTPVSIKADRLPVTPVSFAAAQAIQPSQPSSQPIPGPVSSVAQYAALGSGGSDAIGNKLFEMNAALTETPLPSAKSRATPAKPPKSTNVVLNDAQIAHLKERLKLSPSQQQYWPAIETALRGVVKQIYEANKKAHGATVPIDTATPEVERLKTAAMPLLTQLRPDQKAEVVMLARMIGMEKMITAL